MDQEVHKNMALSSKVILSLLVVLEDEWKTENKLKQEVLALIGAYVCFCFGGSFHGHKVFLVDLSGLLKYLTMNPLYTERAYVIIPIFGGFRAEDGKRYHLTPLAFTTNSGIEIGKWAQRLAEMKRLQGLMNGPAFSDKFRNRVNPKWLEMDILYKAFIV
jgi:hypothetical protein